MKAKLIHFIWKTGTTKKIGHNGEAWPNLSIKIFPFFSFLTISSLCYVFVSDIDHNSGFLMKRIQSLNVKA